MILRDLMHFLVDRGIRRQRKEKWGVGAVFEKKQVAGRGASTLGKIEAEFRRQIKDI